MSNANLGSSPDFLKRTSIDCVYCLEMLVPEGRQPAEYIEDITREEYVAIKAFLAHMRGQTAVKELS